MRDYEWSQKSPFQKKCLGVFTFFSVIVWSYVVLTFSTGHPMTWADFNWRVAWGILKCILIIALFPAILVPVLLTFESKYPSELQHTFYREWARLLTGYGKGAGPICFFVEDVEGARLQRSAFKDKSIFVLTIQFKTRFFGRSPARVAIRAEKEAELRPLEDWLRKNQIMVTWELPLEIQRQS